MTVIVTKVPAMAASTVAANAEGDETLAEGTSGEASTNVVSISIPDVVGLTFSILPH